VSFIYVYLPERTNQIMQDITIAQTNSTPQVDFATNGNLFLKGRSLILDVDVFYQPLCDWVRRLGSPTVIFNLKIDYFNSASSKKILEMLKIIDSNNNVKDFDVFWHFETDDEDILEIGQIFEERLRKAKFYFKEYAEV
jgi:hypothetical protein